MKARIAPRLAAGPKGRSYLPRLLLLVFLSVEGVFMRVMHVIRGMVMAGGVMAAECAHYATPGRGADLRAVGVSQAMVANGTEAGIAQTLGKRPPASQPTGIAVARLQAPRYRSATAEGFGDGRYSVVTTRDVEPDAAVERLAKMKMVR